MCPHRLPKTKPSADKDHRSSEGGRGRGRLPQRRCLANFLVRSPEYSPLRPPLSSSEDSSSEHSSSSHVGSPGGDGPTEIPKLCPPPYGFHFGAQQKALSGLAGTRAAAADVETPRPSAPPLSNAPPQWRERALSPKRILKPPPPYTRLVRTPSLKEYPNHAIRLLPREIVSEELKSWHQRIQRQKTQPGCPDQQGPPRSPAPPHLPSFQQVGAAGDRLKATFAGEPSANLTTPFQQGSGNLVLQRDPDGTPVQWFVAEDAEIVSQV